MSAIQSPLTYEQVLEMFRQTDLQFQETDKKFQETAMRFQETDKKFQETDKRISALGDRIGELIELIVHSGVVRKFRELKYDFSQCARRVDFKNTALGIYGEIDLFLENGEYVLAVEVKTKSSVDYVNDHIERLEKYRRYLDAKGDKRKIIGAIGGGIIDISVRNYALKKGLYVIVQTGETIEILLPGNGQPAIW